MFSMYLAPSSLARIKGRGAEGHWGMKRRKGKAPGKKSIGTRTAAGGARGKHCCGMTYCPLNKRNLAHKG